MKKKSAKRISTVKKKLIDVKRATEDGEISREDGEARMLKAVKKLSRKELKKLVDRVGLQHGVNAPGDEDEGDAPEQEPTAGEVFDDLREIMRICHGLLQLPVGAGWNARVQQIGDEAMCLFNHVERLTMWVHAHDPNVLDLPITTLMELAEGDPGDDPFEDEDDELRLGFDEDEDEELNAEELACLRVRDLEQRALEAREEYERRYNKGCALP